jgi:HAD superfamily hydrolase (TIGR01662 family)
VARGLITEDQLAEVHERLRELLLEQGARLDAIYCCPYLDGPDAIVAEYRQASPLRKPEAGMLLQAAEDLELDLEQSWMIGDSARDVHAGKAAGARTILIAEGPSDAPADYTCRDLESAVATVLAPASTLRSRPPAAFVPTQPAPQTGPDLTEVAGLLTEIRDMLRRKERASQHEDFSVARLIGTLAQMLALVAAAWGIAALLGRPEAAAPRVLLAVFLQLAALTAFMSERR